MAISPDESIVALARDDTLATYYASSGIEISVRKYSGHKVEHIAFNGQSNQLFVVVRRTMSLKLGSRLLDPLQLKSQVKTNPVPIPIIGKTILAILPEARFKNKELIFEADGSKIRCYALHEPIDPDIATTPGTLVKRTTVFRLPTENRQKVYPKVGSQDDHKNEANMKTNQEDQEGSKEDKQYKLRIKAHNELFPDGDGLMYWVPRVELVEESQGYKKVIFSFVPEPWMRISTMDASYPDILVSAYFLPGGTRFVVTGIQTLQIWSFPTDKYHNFSLDFIWSHPRMIDDANSKAYGKAFKSERVGECYHFISAPKIYLYETSGNLVANFGQKDDVVISAESGDNTFIYCARSIHLLAAAYAYSKKESKRTSRNTSQGAKLTFEDYAEAIARFTRGHINRQLSAQDFNQQSTVEESLSWRNDLATSPKTNPTSVTSKFIDHLSQRRAVLTLLTLLLDRQDFKNANLVFVEGLLGSDDVRWVPHADMTLNPINLAIEIKDEQLLQILINYCINCTKKYHPAYMAPVEQCLAELLEQYPDTVANVFRWTSYIPVLNHAYVWSHAIGTSAKFQDLLSTGGSKTNSINIHDDESEVFTLRSQLPIATASKSFFFNGHGNLNHGSDTRFPRHEKEQATRKNQSHKIYVSPFQFRPITAQESIFVQIAGKDFFENPAVVATLRFRWNKYGMHYWLLRFSLVFLFFILVLVITAKQIAVSSVSNPTADDIAARYMPEWRPVFIVTIVTGLLLIAYELMQMKYSRFQYFG
ncbi:hypothetical protein BGZ65_002318, partial [Modicella reniformis]